jgi:hypothetical protein
MRISLAAAIFLALAAASAAAVAQDATPAPPPSQAPGGWRGERGGRGEGGFAGHGIVGSVTAVAADRYTVKTEAGEIYTVRFSANTHIQKQTGERRGEGGRGWEGGGNPGQTVKSTDIKVGDAIVASGEIDAAAKSVGAVFIVQVDPERAKQMREMRANFGKTWLMGKVTAVNDLKVTLHSEIDNADHVFIADENTAFRKRREPIALADIQIGDTVRVEGAVKDGAFVAASVNVMGMPPGGTPSVPRDSPPPPQTK